MHDPASQRLQFEKKNGHEFWKYFGAAPLSGMSGVRQFVHEWTNFHGGRAKTRKCKRNELWRSSQDQRRGAKRADSHERESIGDLGQNMSIIMNGRTLEILSQMECVHGKWGSVEQKAPLTRGEAPRPLPAGAGRGYGHCASAEQNVLQRLIASQFPRPSRRSRFSTSPRSCGERSRRFAAGEGRLHSAARDGKTHEF
jgi:hypothetical protein